MIKEDESTGNHAKKGKNVASAFSDIKFEDY